MFPLYCASAIRGRKVCARTRAMDVGRSTEVNRLSGQVHGVNILAYAKCSFKGLKLLY